ncbi:MAG: 2-hexaprenyl-6-methoxy-1,4-benzoquinone methyltransferase [Watsoniomyces obsoletus]|nr:MAG: 2-hexaprenyl-6-methoxy-1,4-benzoquinone methyltransferase [Watsoniomyces obsoletus]
MSSTRKSTNPTNPGRRPPALAPAPVTATTAMTRATTTSSTSTASTSSSTSTLPPRPVSKGKQSIQNNGNGKHHHHDDNDDDKHDDDDEKEEASNSDDNKSPDEDESPRYPAPPSRIQQKLWLQRASSNIESLARIQQSQFEKVQGEYHVMRRFQDPLLESLRRM